MNKNISLRDFFAAMAMQGELACQRPGYECIEESNIAKWAYAIADAMMVERENQKNKGKT